MAEKTLTDLGANCTQTETTITLNKANLGLTVADASLDQIMVAIAVKAATVLTQNNFETEANQNVYFSNGFSSFTTKNNTAWVVRQLIINMAKPDTEATINPNTY